MTILSRAACLLSLPVMLWGAPAFAAPLTIEQIAPKNSVLVLSIDNTQAALDAFNRTGFRKTWDEPAMQTWFKDTVGKLVEDFWADVEKLGLEKDQLKHPTGPAGMAAWFTPPQDEGGEPQFNMIMAAEYAGEAEAMNKLVTDLIERGEKDKVLELKQDEHNGITVYSLTFIREEGAPGEKPPANDPAGEGEEDFNLEDLEGGEPQPFLNMNTEEMHYALTGTQLMASTSRTVLEEAIDRAKGDDMDSVADAADFTAITAQLGEGQHARVVLLAQPYLEQMKSEAAAQEEAEFADQFFEILGVRDLKGAGMGLRFDTEKAMMEQNIIISTPTKKGIMALLDTPSVALDAPPFIAENTSSFYMFQIDLPAIPGMVNKFLEAMPDDGGMQAQMMGGFTQFLAPVLQQLGPQVYIANAYQRPLAPDSMQMTAAIKVRDAQALAGALGQLGAQFGFASRDFQGGQIWSAEGGMLPIEIALGLAAGHLFIGTGENVENAIRQASAEGAAAGRLANEDAFKAAKKNIADSGLAIGYADTRQELEWLDWSLRNADKIAGYQFDQQMGRFGDPEDPQFKEFRERTIKDAQESMNDMLKSMPDLRLFSKHLGDTIMDGRSTPEGFVIRSFMLRPQ